MTADDAIKLPRFEFIARWLVEATRKKPQRPLGKHVTRTGGTYKIRSPIGGGVVEYATRDPAALFDYARHGVLGPIVRDADAFRVYAHEDLETRGARLGIPTRDKTPAPLDREIAEVLARTPRTPRTKPAWRD